MDSVKEQEKREVIENLDTYFHMQATFLFNVKTTALDYDDGKKNRRTVRNEWVWDCPIFFTSVISS